MYIPNDDTQNCPFCSLRLVVDTFEYSKFTEVSKVIEPTNKKTL